MFIDVCFPGIRTGPSTLMISDSHEHQCEKNEILSGKTTLLTIVTIPLYYLQDCLPRGLESDSNFLSWLSQLVAVLDCRVCSGVVRVSQCSAGRFL